MKKHYILFFLFSWISFYGQTYNFKITSGIQCNICQEEGAPPGGPTYNSWTATNYYYLIKYNNTTISTENTNYVSYTNSVPRYSVAIPNGSLFTVTMTSKGSVHYDITSGPCNTTEPPKTMSLKDLIINGTVGFQNYPCGLSANINSFTPVVDIKNADTQNPNEVCAGFTLGLNAFPLGFPSEAYHWQYSFDDVSWMDFPAGIANNTPAPVFSMQQLLGASHENYLNKTIYFRLGYPYRPFTKSLPIKYNACTLILKDRKIIPPDCSYGSLKNITVEFDRDLIANETLGILHIVPYPKIVGPNESQAIRFEQPTVTKLVYNPATKWYAYSFVMDPSQKLENRKYIIEYQSFINGVARGTMTAGDNFLYQEPAPLTFSLAQTAPSCNNDPGKVTITANGGSGEYYYYSLDGGTRTQFTNKTIVTQTNVNGSMVETRTGNQEIILPTISKTTYGIQVTDEKEWIDKTANDANVN